MTKSRTVDEPKFRNVGLLLEDHEMLRIIADREQRSMARQLSVLIRKALDSEKEV
mgnify:FL=1